MIDILKVLRRILTVIAIFLLLNLVFDIGYVALNFKSPLASFFEKRIYYMYYIADVLLFFLLLRFTFFNKIYFWTISVIVIAIKFVLLIDFYVMKPYAAFSVPYNSHYSDFFDVLGWSRIASLFFGNHLISFFLFAALYSYIIYLYVKIIRQQIHER